MSDVPSSFAAALRAEIDAVVTRWEALARAHADAHAEARERDTAALRAELAEARAAEGRLRAAAVERDAELAALRAREAELTRELADARARAKDLEGEARTAGEAARALSEQFAVEQRFVAACKGLEGSLLGEALRGALGRDLEASPAAYAAIKARGLEVLLTATFKERGRNVVQAPLLDRERAALPAIAAAAGCELSTPAAGTRFSAAAMDKASVVAEPAEEGNVVECLIPGVRRAGTEGALVLPRVVVATG